MVDRYLASPHYGERWGKYWLDVAGYADSNGYFSADSDRPLAYRYRDYVIRSFNQDNLNTAFLPSKLPANDLPANGPGADAPPRWPNCPRPRTSRATPPAAPARANATPT